MRGLKTVLAASVLATWAGSAAAQSTLHIGLAEDPDILDPTLAQTYVGRIVFAGLCDKLFDITPDLKMVPQLATGYEWSSDGKALTIGLRPGVKFQDGEKLDAEAAKYSIERHLTMQGSKRRSEISALQGIDVDNDHQITLHL
ncbi:MAG: ABC transporter substrate-binding protein, partial [Alphaproteobacteria bacterium]|nr:ABC transporter substrate-binding protein [Alphaproteobacteria bacterium]